MSRFRPGDIVTITDIRVMSTYARHVLRSGVDCIYADVPNEIADGHCIVIDNLYQCSYDMTKFLYDDHNKCDYVLVLTCDGELCLVRDFSAPYHVRVERERV